MATVTLFDAERMQDIEDGTVVDGSVNGFGHLILERHDGSTSDAGKVTADNLADASDTVKGIVRLATDAEAIAGTNDLTAVTPQDLDVVFSDKKTNANFKSTTTQRGVIEIATDAEIATGTDPDRAVVAATLENRLNSKFLTGQVDPNWTFGLPMVTLSSGPNSGSTHQALISRYEPNPGENVWLEVIGLNYLIVQPVITAPAFLKQLPLTLASGWILYDDSQQVYSEPIDNAALASRNKNVYVTMSSMGIVSVMGFIIATSTPTAGDIIVSLPANMWPSRPQVFEAVGSGGYATVYVTPDGNVRYLSGAATTYFSLDGITFRSKTTVTSGVSPFVPLGTLLNGWVTYTLSFGPGDPGGSISHTPGYTIDADGVVIFEGVISSGTNANVVQCTALATQLTDLFSIAAAGSTGNAYFRFGGSGGTGIGNWLVSSAGGTWDSLATIIIMPASTTTTWKTAQFYDSWAGYTGAGTSYSLGQIAKTPEGFVLCRGMLASGGIGVNTPIWILSKGWRPRYAALSICIANSSAALLYKGQSWSTANNGKNHNSGITMNNGSNVWASMANLNWFAYQ